MRPPPATLVLADVEPRGRRRPRPPAEFLRRPTWAGPRLTTPTSRPSGAVRDGSARGRGYASSPTAPRQVPAVRLMMSMTRREVLGTAVAAGGATQVDNGVPASPAPRSVPSARTAAARSAIAAATAPGPPPLARGGSRPRRPARRRLRRRPPRRGSTSAARRPASSADGRPGRRPPRRSADHDRDAGPPTGAEATAARSGRPAARRHQDATVADATATADGPAGGRPAGARAATRRGRQQVRVRVAEVRAAGRPAATHWPRRPPRATPAEPGGQVEDLGRTEARRRRARR